MLGFGEKMLERDTGERKDYAARYEELIDLVEAEELEVIEKEEVAVDAKTVVAESVAGEQKVMTQIEEEPAMMNPTILEEVTNGDTCNNREDYMSGMWRRTCASNGTPRSKYRKTILWLFQFPEVQIHIKYC